MRIQVLDRAWRLAQRLSRKAYIIKYDLTLQTAVLCRGFKMGPFRGGVKACAQACKADKQL